MGTREFAEQMKATIEAIRAEGTAAIYCDNLIAYLDQVAKSPEPNPSAADLERYRADLQLSIDANKHRHEAALESFRAVITAGQSAIKTILLVNGGAALASLAFAGHLVTAKPAMVSAVAGSMVPFTLGVLSAGLVSGGTYLAQFCFGHPGAIWQRVGGWLNTAVIVLGIGAYMLFGWGMLATYAVLTAP